MKPKQLLLRIGAALFLLALLVVLFRVLTPPVPVAHIRVVDESGRPVAGAIIAPDGLRPKKNGGHYMWDGNLARSGLKAVTVRTDTDGYAAVRYPFYVIERLETAEISFAVDHPDFCAERPFRVVSASPPSNASYGEKLKYWVARLTHRISTRPNPVVLKRGGVVRLTGYVGTREKVVTNLHADISGMWPAGTGFWQRAGPVLWSGRVAPGPGHLRPVHLPADGPPLFGDLVSFDAKAGETNEFALELQPGARVSARLDEAVPRPVRHGRVCTRVFAEGHDGNSEAPVWIAWRPVNEDGTFTFESLPPGRMELIGICEGFVSQQGPSPSGVTSSQRLPQLFPLHRGQQHLVLPMEAAASFEVTVLDDAGRPLAGAEAGLWPNVLWGGNGSTIFAEDIFNTEDFFRHGPGMNWLERRHWMENDFRAISDARGVVLVRTLPAGRQSYSVTHTNYEMPVVRSGGSAGRSASVTLAPGETGRVTVRMQKRGTEELTH